MAGRPPSFALLDAPRVLRLIADGERYDAIAARYGVDRSTIGKIARRHGVIRARGRPKGSRDDPANRAEIRRLTSNGSWPQLRFTAAEARAILGLAA